ncbi:hypothetical protein LX16_5149 [Stackebrandtia albiflava]|uniref:Lipoprotein LprG n=1 Tax=Stackebrandtia albiflava TaxID=406432 RepID=A0A562ULC0_9ACTN|nr:hypothetical protein [Stackebrandtia albiflava]TWJ06413.1 hypothetical protein LX16_5149 [Stackebrandtia albiflava]
MKPPTVTGRIAGLTAIAGLALALAACSGDQGAIDDTGADSGDTGTETRLDPAAAVDASVATLEETSYSLTMTVGDLIDGTFSVDPATGDYHAQTTTDAATFGVEGVGDITTEVVGIGTDMWIKTSGALATQLGTEGKWIHTTTDGAASDIVGMDMKRLTEELLASFENIEATGDNTYTATIDPAKMSDLGGDAPVEAVIVLDDSGRLQSVTADIPDPLAEDGSTLPVAIEVTGYDVAVDAQEPPADQVVELTELMP